MSHQFIILRNGNIETYNEYEDIPENFEHVISFLPEIPEPPHTEEQHIEMSKWNDRLKELMKREIK